LRYWWRSGLPVVIIWSVCVKLAKEFSAIKLIFRKRFLKAGMVGNRSYSLERVFLGGTNF